MSYDALEQSIASGEPYDLYAFHVAEQQFYFTSADVAITYLGQVYQPVTIDRDQLEHTNEVVSGQVKIYFPASNPVAQMLIPYLPTTPIAVVIYGGHFGDSEVVVQFSGKIVNARFTDECEATCNSDIYALQYQIPKQKYESLCTHIFGDAGCTMNLDDFSYSGTVSAIDSTGTVLTVPDFASLPHSLKAGYVKRGNDYRMIMDHTGDQITLIAPIANASVGDVVVGVAGCQLTYAACAGYSNTAHFLGFDLIPAINPFNASIA